MMRAKLRGVNELYSARNVEEANRKMKEGWELLDVIIGLRHVYHEPHDENDTPYAFDAPYFSALLGRSKKKPDDLIAPVDEE